VRALHGAYTAAPMSPLLCIASIPIYSPSLAGHYRKCYGVSCAWFSMQPTRSLQNDWMTHTFHERLYLLAIYSKQQLQGCFVI
jgi:hypothetical protein